MRYLPLLLLCIACTNPVADIETPEPVPESAESAHVEQVEYTEPEIEYTYTIIGTWERCFDNHREFYVFTEDTLTTYCDGVQNGLYAIEYTEDWTFVLCQTVFDYELMRNGDLEALVLNGYEYRRVR